MATKVAKKKLTGAKSKDPAAWLASKLGPKGSKDFLKGLKIGAKHIAAGKLAQAEVEGQGACSTYCMSYCYPGSPMNNGYFSSVYINT